MKLIFIHGWGFDAGFWDPLAGLLAEQPQQRVDLGFFGAATDAPATDEPAILIGHSLGFLRGMRWRRNWAGWVAINSFANFAHNAARLRAMRKNFQSDPAATLRNFYTLVDTPHDLSARAISGPSLDHQRLLDGLDQLRDSALVTTALPGLVLAASNDPLVPITVSQHLAATYQAPIAWHATGGHLLPQNDPAWCAEQITRWLREPARRSVGATA